MSESGDEVMVSEWSYLFDADEASEKVLKLAIAPDADAVKALEKRLGVLALADFQVRLEVKRHGQVVYINGDLSATVTQPCVVSLQPVVTDVQDRFEAWYADPDAAISIAKKRREKEMQKGKADLPMLDEHEDPEPIIDGQIDLGELAVQYLSLAIDPYVHAEGVAYEHGDDAQGDSAGAEHRNNPFAALKDWKDKLT